MATAEISTPARKNPAIYVRVFLAVVFLGVALRRGGLWWLLGVAGVLGLVKDLPALWRNDPTSPLGL